MVAVDHPLGIEQFLKSRVAELIVDPVTHPKIRIDNRAGPPKKNDMIVGYYEADEQRPAKTALTLPAVSEFHVLPDALVVVRVCGFGIELRAFLGQLLNEGDEIFVQLTATKIPDAQVIKYLGQRYGRCFLVHIL